MFFHNPNDSIVLCVNRYCTRPALTDYTVLLNKNEVRRDASNVIICRHDAIIDIFSVMEIIFQRLQRRVAREP